MPDRSRQNIPVETDAVAAQGWQAAPVAMAVVGPAGVLACNRTCRDLLGEILGGTDLAARRWLAAAASRMLAAGRSGEELTTGLDGQVLSARLGAPLAGGEARVISLGSPADGSRRSDGLAETVSTLSHELRTPLTSIKSSLGLVISGETGPVTGDQEHFLSMTMRNINRLERLVSDLLDVSHDGDRPVVDRSRVVDLGPMLREALEMQETAANAAGLTLDFTGLPSRLTAHLDPDKVQQILANIVGNALKYTPPGGRVRVWVEDRQRWTSGGLDDLAPLLSRVLQRKLETFTLVVEDSGPGLSPIDQERVFEPWFRGRQEAGSRVPGAGLGLSITRSLVESHGGRIRLASAPGHGTCVWINLPRDPASEDFLRAARRLQALLGQGPDRHLALLNAPSARPAGDVPWCAAVTEWVQRHPALETHAVVSLDPDVVAVVVGDPARWADVWRAGGSAAGPGGTRSECRFLAWRSAESNKESIHRLACR